MVLKMTSFGGCGREELTCGAKIGKPWDVITLHGTALRDETVRMQCIGIGDQLQNCRYVFPLTKIYSPREWKSLLYDATRYLRSPYLWFKMARNGKPKRTLTQMMHSLEASG